MKIQPQLLDQLAWIWRDPAAPPVRGIILRFCGLNSTSMKTGPDAFESAWAAAGALIVAPYQDPWGWMNPPTRAFVDDLVTAVRLQHGLAPEIPLLSTGGSMGGHGALLYAMKSAHEIAACLALYPVCDLPFHYTERPDLPRTFHHAYGYGEIAETLRENSPLHQVAAMREMPYLFAHGLLDQAVAKALHSDKQVAAMRERGLKVEYLECPFMAHGSPMSDDEQRQITDFVLRQLR